MTKVITEQLGSGLDVQIQKDILESFDVKIETQRYLGDVGDCSIVQEDLSKEF